MRRTMILALAAIAAGIPVATSAQTSPPKGVECPRKLMTPAEIRMLDMLVSGSGASLGQADAASAREAFKRAKIRCSDAHRWTPRQGQASLFHYVAKANSNKASAALVAGGLPMSIPQSAFGNLTSEQRLKISQNDVSPDILTVLLKAMTDAKPLGAGDDPQAGRNAGLVGGATAGLALVDAASQMFDNPAYTNKMWDTLLAKMDF